MKVWKLNKKMPPFRLRGHLMLIFLLPNQKATDSEIPPYKKSESLLKLVDVRRLSALSDKGKEYDTTGVTVMYLSKGMVKPTEINPSCALLYLFVVLTKLPATLSTSTKLSSLEI